jgi:hypothetical protein
MAEIEYEKQALEYLRLPVKPKHLWDKKTHFDSGLAIVKTITGHFNYAICRYNEQDEAPMIKKVFSGEPFSSIEKIYPMPKYMESDISKMSFNDEESELAMQALINERDAKINKGGDGETDELDKNEWHTEAIHNRQEAIAWLKSKGEKGAMFKTDDALKMKIYSVLMNEKISQ